MDNENKKIGNMFKLVSIYNWFLALVGLALVAIVFSSFFYETSGASAEKGTVSPMTDPLLNELH